MEDVGSEGKDIYNQLYLSIVSAVVESTEGVGNKYCLEES